MACATGRVDVLEDGEQERRATRVPHEHGFLVEGVTRQDRREERLDRITVEARVVRDLDDVAARFEPRSQPSVPAVVRVATGSVEDDRRSHSGLLLESVAACATGGQCAGRARIMG